MVSACFRVDRLHRYRRAAPRRTSDFPGCRSSLHPRAGATDGANPDFSTFTLFAGHDYLGGRVSSKAFDECLQRREARLSRSVSLDLGLAIAESVRAISSLPTLLCEVQSTMRSHAAGRRRGAVRARIGWPFVGDAVRRHLEAQPTPGNRGLAARFARRGVSGLPTGDLRPRGRWAALRRPRRTADRSARRTRPPRAS